MADDVTSQSVEDTDRRVVMSFTNVSDGTGESAVTKVDASTLAPHSRTGLACSSVVLRRLTYSVSGMAISVEWGGSPDKDAITLSGSGSLDMSRFSGLTSDATSPTGDVKFTTLGHTNGDTYSVLVEALKDYSTSAAPPAPAPLAFVGAASSSTATATLVATLPTHSEGDWLVMFIGYDNGQSACSTIPTVTGWTPLQHNRSGSTTFFTGGSLLAKQAGASESAPSITLNGTPDSGCNCWVIAVSGAGSVDASALGVSTTVGGGASIGTPGVSNAADAFVIDFTLNRRNNEAMASADIDDANEDTISFGANATVWYGYRTEVAALGATGVTVDLPDGLFRPATATISLVA